MSVILEQNVFILVCKDVLLTHLSTVVAFLLTSLLLRVRTPFVAVEGAYASLVTRDPSGVDLKLSLLVLVRCKKRYNIIPKLIVEYTYTIA